MPTTNKPLSQVLSWTEDSLMVQDADSLAKVDRPALSASTMNAMRGCPARYVADRLLPRDEDPYNPAPLGTAAHDVFESLFQLAPERRTVDQAIELVVDLAASTWSEHQRVDRLRWGAMVMDKVLPLFDIEDPTQVSVVSVEEQFQGIELAGVPFIGFIDRVCRDEDTGDVEVHDFKTGRAQTAAQAQRFGDEQADQVRLYAAAFEERYGTRPKVGRLVYTAAGKSRKVSMTGPAIRRTIDHFTQAWDDLKTYVHTGEFPCNPTPLCGWCPLVATCPAAAAAGKQARVAVPTADELPIPAPQITTGEPVEEFDALADLIDATEPDARPGQDIDNHDAEVGHGEPGAAHLDGDEYQKEAPAMSGFVTRERKPWEDPPDEGIDPASYTATAMFGLVTTAVERLDQAGIKVTPTTVDGLAGTLATVVLDAQETVMGVRDWQAGSNTRIRGALHTVLDTVPLPFGQDEDAWQLWVQKATRRCVSIANAVISLHEDDAPDQPWQVLATMLASNRAA